MIRALSAALRAASAGELCSEGSGMWFGLGVGMGCGSSCRWAAGETRLGYPFDSETNPDRHFGRRAGRFDPGRRYHAGFMQTERGVRNADAVGGAFIVLASLQFGIVVVLGRIVTDGPKGMPVPAMLAIRFGLAAVLLLGTLAVLHRSPLPARGERVPLAVLAVAGYAVEASLFFLAVQHGEAAAVTLLF